MMLQRWVTSDGIWPTFDGWCMEHGIDAWEVPADRWMNLVYYFATKNMSRDERAKFDAQIADANARWITIEVEDTVRQRVEARRAELESAPTDRPRGRERRLPPKPAWYGAKDQATRSTLAAKNTLTSRGKKRPARG